MNRLRLSSFLILVSAICLLGQMRAFAVTIPVEDDSMVNETSTPTDLTAHNYGRASSADVYGSSGNNRWTYFHFNDITADLPDGTTQNNVVRATLYLFVRDVVEAGAFKAYSVSASWLEGAQAGAAQSGSLSWSNKPASSSTGINGDSSVGVATADKGEYIGIPVTDLVKSWITTPGGNHGIVLKPHGTEIQVSFDSKENTETSHPAFLEVILEPVAIPGQSHWYSGEGHPNEQDGVPGDFYLKTSTSEYYVKTANGWGAPRAIVGAQGPQGPVGLGYGGTSATSVTVGTGVKYFTTQSNLAYQQGSRIRLTRNGDSGTWMEGVYSPAVIVPEGECATLVFVFSEALVPEDGQLLTVTVYGNSISGGSQSFIWEYDSDSSTSQALAIDITGHAGYGGDFLSHLAYILNLTLNNYGVTVEQGGQTPEYGWVLRLTTSEIGSQAQISVQLSGASAPVWGGWDQGVDTQFETSSITVDLLSGSGTHNDWRLSIAGERGAPGVTTADGLTGTTLAPSITISSLVRVGTITHGVWNAFPVEDNYIASAAAWNAKQDAIGAGGITNSMLAGGIDLETKVDGTLPVENGGTGQTTLAGAINALLPDQNGNAGNVLTTDGGQISWSPPTSATKKFTVYNSGTTALEVGARAAIDTATSAVGIELPADPDNGDMIEVIDIGFNLGTNACTITPSAGHTINGLSTLVLSKNRSHVTLIFNGTNWAAVMPAPLRIQPQGDVLMSYTAGPTP